MGSGDRHGRFNPSAGQLCFLAAGNSRLVRKRRLFLGWKFQVSKGPYALSSWRRGIEISLSIPDKRSRVSRTGEQLHRPPFDRQAEREQPASEVEPIDDGYREFNRMNCGGQRRPQRRRVRNVLAVTL